jgi:hypothetical protein
MPNDERTYQKRDQARAAFMDNAALRKTYPGWRKMRASSLYTSLRAYGYKWNEADGVWIEPTSAARIETKVEQTAPGSRIAAGTFMVRILAHSDEVEALLEDFRTIANLAEWEILDESDFYPLQGKGIMVRVYMTLHKDK